MAPRDIRVALIGDEGVGKSSIISALIKSVSAHGKATGLYSIAAFDIPIDCPNPSEPNRAELTAAPSLSLPTWHIQSAVPVAARPHARREAFVRLAPRTVLPEVTIPPSVTPGHDVTTVIIDTSRALPSSAPRLGTISLMMDGAALPQLDQKTRVISSTRSGKLTSSPSSVSPHCAATRGSTFFCSKATLSSRPRTRMRLTPLFPRRLGRQPQLV